MFYDIKNRFLLPKIRILISEMCYETYLYIKSLSYLFSAILLVLYIIHECGFFFVFNDHIRLPLISFDLGLSLRLDMLQWKLYILLSNNRQRIHLSIQIKMIPSLHYK